MKLLRVILATCFFMVGGYLGAAVAQPSASQRIPRDATIEVTLLKAPGVTVSETRWEIDYEFRLATETDLWNASRSANSKGIAAERAGELLTKGSLTRTINSPKDQTFTLKIPLNMQAQDRLRNQPKNRLNLTAGNLTPENLKLLEEQKRLSQVFMFYSIVNVHDGKLKKTVVIPISRGWDFSNHRNARFGITIEIKDDRTYSWKSW